MSLDKDVRKLNRRELVELLVIRTRQIERLEEQVRRLEEKLADKHLRMEKTGSIAEAALAINGVFQAAQQAADQYLESIRQMEQEERNRLKGARNREHPHPKKKHRVARRTCRMTHTEQGRGIDYHSHPEVPSVDAPKVVAEGHERTPAASESEGA